MTRSRRQRPVPSAGRSGFLVAAGAGTLGCLMALVGATAAWSAEPQVSDLTEPGALYEAACASCHGPDGRGLPAEQVGFEDPGLPDFTDCAFASREPGADWYAVTHAGGPVRGFSDRMPAFGDALSEQQLEAILEHVYGMCESAEWPRGELNLPRALVTEKAYPEDEAVWTTTAATEGNGSVINELLYEKRFGPRNQIEIKLPFGVRELAPDGGWSAGIGDLAVGVKRALHHDLEAGRIFSVGAEVVLPTGDASEGFGNDTVVFEPFLAAGFILPSDSFVHLQAGAELPADTDVADHETFYRAALGKTFATGPKGFGRAWSPMVELLATTELGDQTETRLDLLPQLQVTLNTRQHVMANIGVRIPVTSSGERDTRLMFYLLWDWFDGGLFDGW